MARVDANERELVDVQRAAALLGRHPETVRRWIWSGRLAARREGRRLLIARDDVDAIAGGNASMTLREWAEKAAAARAADPTRARVASAADLVIEDRARQSSDQASNAGR